MVHDRIPICTGGQQRRCVGVCVWRVGYLGGGGVRDKTESEISFVPAGSAPTFLLPCCQFYQSHARTQTQIRISRDPLFPYIRVLLRRIYRTEAPRLALFLQMATFRPRFIALYHRTHACSIFLPRAAGNWTWTRYKPFRPCIFLFAAFPALMNPSSYFVFCRVLYFARVFDLAEIVSCRLVMSPRVFVLLLAESRTRIEIESDKDSKYQLFELF